LAGISANTDCGSGRGTALWCGFLLPCRTFARNAAASVWPTIPAPGIAGVVAASRPGWAGQQRTRSRFNGVRQQVASPSGIAGWRSTSEPLLGPIALGFGSQPSKGNGVACAKRSVMVDRLGSSVSRVAGARPRRVRTPQQSVAVIRRGQAPAGRQS
jgi:hypothetical protein